MAKKKSVIVLSGGLDSTAALYRIKDAVDVIAVSFNYGQKHKKELDFAASLCADLKIKHHIIDLWSSGYTEAISNSGSSLVTNVDVPEGHYEADNMASTVVPNRNAVMISIAASIAMAEGADNVIVGVHGGDHHIYADCRPEFIEAMNQVVRIASGGKVSVAAPYLYDTKTAIAADALANAIPLDKTWSCYKGGEIHCGRCGTCVERIEAIEEARAWFSNIGQVMDADPTEYEDHEFWLTVKKEN